MLIIIKFYFKFLNTIIRYELYYSKSKSVHQYAFVVKIAGSFDTNVDLSQDFIKNLKSPKDCLFIYKSKMDILVLYVRIVHKILLAIKARVRPNMKN
jgi:hypothetical protein